MTTIFRCVFRNVKPPYFGLLGSPKFEAATRERLYSLIIGDLTRRLFK